MDTAAREAQRANRLNSLFNHVLHGKKPISGQGKLFLEAIAIQRDAAGCVTRLILSEHGILSIKTAVSSDISIAWFNSTIAELLEFLRKPEVKEVGGGDYLQRVIQLGIADAPGFWDSFVDAFIGGMLKEKAQSSFAWLLLQLLYLPNEDSEPYRRIAEREETRKYLEAIVDPNGRSFVHKIIKITSATGPAPKVSTGSSPGGRHDNDSEDFRTISILPTAEEIHCQVPPFLRPSSFLVDPETETNRAAIYLDNTFRLLREDMLYEMREEIARWSKGRQARRGFSINGLTLVGVHTGVAGRRSMAALKLQYNGILPQLADKKLGLKDVASRKNYLLQDGRGKKLLRNGSLTCLILDDRVTAFPVLVRDEDLLSQSKAIFLIQITDKRIILDVLLRLKAASTVKLVQIDVAIFAYEPVLLALQNIKDIPFGEELLNWKEGSQVNQAGLTAMLQTRVAELRRYPKLDLSKADHLDITGGKPIVLDGAQMVSLIAGLTQQVSLIQGPPGYCFVTYPRARLANICSGTGKSFIGGLLAKYIFKYTTQSILVVCYTNHALDQFLDDIRNMGVPDEHIVRLGNKVSASLDHLSMRSQPHNRAALTPADKKIIHEAQADAEIHANSIDIAFNGYHNLSVQSVDIMMHIEFEDEEYFIAFAAPKVEDDMVVVGSGGKAIGEYYLLERWMNGKNAGYYHEINHPHITAHSKIWDMSIDARNAKLMIWQKQIIEDQAVALYGYIGALNRTQKTRQQKNSLRDVATLQSKRIIGCTTTGAAKYTESIRAARPDVLLVEEAGEILESHVITALAEQMKQMILIGDHK
jgi:hypothetical protein